MLERFHDAPKYALDPMAEFPRKWRDHIGPLRVVGVPHEGYVMVRRPGCAPFILLVCELLNAEPHRFAGPFLVVDKAMKRVRLLAVSGRGKR